MIEQLNNDLPTDNDPSSTFSEYEGLAGSIFSTAWDLLEMIGILSPLPLLSLRYYAGQLVEQKPCRLEFIDKAEDLLERVLEIAYQQALEMPDIEDEQYQPGEVDALALEIAFELLSDADYSLGSGSDVEEVRDLIISLAIDLDNQIEAEKRDLEALIRNHPIGY